MSDVTLPGRKVGRASAYDVMNGSKQTRAVKHEGEDTVLKGMLIKDYPVLVEFE